MINATPQTLKERFFQPPYVRGVAFSLLAFNFANLYRITCCCRRQWRAAEALRHATAVIPSFITTGVPPDKTRWHAGRAKR